MVMFFFDDVLVALRRAHSTMKYPFFLNATHEDIYIAYIADAMVITILHCEMKSSNSSIDRVGKSTNDCRSIYLE